MTPIEIIDAKVRYLESKVAFSQRFADDYIKELRYDDALELLAKSSEYQKQINLLLEVRAEILKTK